MKRIQILTLTFVLLLGLSAVSNAQVSVPVGVTEVSASQLVAYFQDNDEVDFQYFQVTNTGTGDVTLHIQFWISDDGSGDPTTAAGTCLEVNFVDTLTGKDTHTYDTDEITLNTDPCVPADSCDATDAVVDLDNTSGFDYGFMTVTPVVGATDRRAIAYNNLFGEVVSQDVTRHTAKANMMGRLAVSFSDGSLLADGTILDGVSGGYVLLRPEVLAFNFSNLDPQFILQDEFEGVNEALIVNIVFADNYSGPFGDYRSQPADASFDTLVFDEAEVPTSCNSYTPTCVISQGVNEEIIGSNDDPPGGSPNIILCPGNTLDNGWVRLAVTGLDGLENALGYTHFIANGDNVGGPTDSYAFARWMVTQGDTVVPTPEPTPTPMPSPSPTDGGASPTPTGGGQPGGGGGGGGGCAIAGPVQAGTAAANMLMVLLPGAVLALRRKIKKT